MQKILISLVIFIQSSFVFSVDNQVIWMLDNLTKIGDFQLVSYGNPGIIETDKGKAIEFNVNAVTAPATGAGDRIQIKGIPAGILSNDFTIEMIFKPYPTNTDFAPRVLHICRPDSMSGPRVMTMEIRSTNEWSTDFYIKSVFTSGILGTKKYPTNQWMHMAMTLKNGVLKGYVNGDLDVTYNGSRYTGMSSLAEISLGGRMNNVNYFRGAILKIIFTPVALEPSQFTLTDITGVSNLPSGKENLLKNYPNPVSDHTIISYSLAEAGKVRLELFNCVGQRIHLTDYTEISEGKHEIYISRQSLPSGLYLYKLTTQSGVEITRKMEFI